jgi:hypothetical protein
VERIDDKHVIKTVQEGATHTCRCTAIVSQISTVMSSIFIYGKVADDKFSSYTCSSYFTVTLRDILCFQDSKA